MLLVFPVLVTRDCNTPHLNGIKFPKKHAINAMFSLFSGLMSDCLIEKLQSG